MFPCLGPDRFDDVDAPVTRLGEPDMVDDETEGLCTYLILSSPEKLLLNVTTPAISVLRDVLQVRKGSRIGFSQRVTIPVL